MCDDLCESECKTDIQVSENGIDDNYRFPPRSYDKAPSSSSSSSSYTSAYSSESEELPQITSVHLETAVTPFTLVWSFGLNVKVPFINLTTKDRKMIFCAAAHDGVLYDYATNEAKHFQGHQNAITAIAADKLGKYLATADSGKDNSIIVWNLSTCKPVRVIFDANPGSGTSILAMSDNGKYLINATSDAVPVVKFWMWTMGEEQSNDTYEAKPAYGKIVSIIFNPNVQENIMIGFEKIVVFLKWDPGNLKFCNKMVPAIKNRNRAGLISDVTYIENCHKCLASTMEGCVLIFGSTCYIKEYTNDDDSNVKIFINTIKVSKTGINCINAIDGIVATCDTNGKIKFFDTSMKILYWCQNFTSQSILCMSIDMEPRHYKFEDPTNLDDEHFVIPSPRKIIDGEFVDVSNSYEVLYENMVPTDATLHRHAFIVRNFMLATSDGNIVKVDFLDNTCEPLFFANETSVMSIDLHDEEPYLAIGYKNGRISLYDYLSHVMIRTFVLPEGLMKSEDVEDEFQLMMDDVDSSDLANVTYMKYSPKCFHLAVGRSNGEVWFVDPIMLDPKIKEPYSATIYSVEKMCFSCDSKYFAYYDINRTVCLFMYVNEKHCWNMCGKIRSHAKQLTDIMFSTGLPLELYSIGLDKYFVKYDLSQCTEKTIGIELRERIEQTALPYCIIPYPLVENIDCYLLANDQFKFKVMEAITRKQRNVFLGPAYGCFSEAPVRKFSILPNFGNEYLIFCTEKLIGIQILPPDGNPYKYTGTIGHPVKLTDYRVSVDGKYIFTFGENDTCVLMWQINPDAVENLCHIGGRELEPFYCLIEGGRNGWLLSEMQNLFYYMQIVQQGENTLITRNVNDRINHSELPDLMRACGFYPSEYEVDLMLTDAKNQCKVVVNGVEVNEISFVDFIKLYINHRPAHGISMAKLKDGFEALCDFGDLGGGSIGGENFADVICDNGERFTKAAAKKCLKILLSYNQEHIDAEEDKDGDTDTETEGTEEVGDFSFLPETTKVIRPDLNPIENIWGLIVKRIKKFVRLRTAVDIWESVENEWEALSENEDLAHNLVHSMPRRLNEVIARNYAMAKY